ncbi:TonB family protein [Sphingomonas sp. IC-11]|uniref:TonB family protein n=1 Tax=Sphingomonas sp. IC-11 TaxID=2898528 RepID=UPI001E59A00B|nr:TonB family protein [Sphingomonas sp. IC-11]MCD2316339.1 TonB family protein [Sphingomonas sp. IC-11]
MSSNWQITPAQLSASALLGLCSTAMLSPADAKLAGPADLSAGPTAIRPANWVKATDFPSDALDKGQKGTVNFSIAVDATGAVYRCEIVRSSGTPSLDERACLLMKRNGRFKPALDKHGNPIPSEHTRRIAWDTKAPLTSSYDVVATVQALASGKKAADFSVRQIVSADGTVESCGIERSSGDADIDRQACKLASQLLPPRKIRAADNTPIRGLRVSRLALLVDDALKGAALP